MKHQRPKEFPNVQDRAWVPILSEICDHKVPEERRIQLAKKVLRSDYQQAWVEVLRHYRMEQLDCQWGVDNWLDQVAGPMRLKALKLLSRHGGPDHSHWDAAISALAFCCKGKDLPVLLRFCKMGMLDGTYALDSMEMFAALARIVLWKREEDYPELFDFIQANFERVDVEHRKGMLNLLLNSEHPRAEAILLDTTNKAGDSILGFLGEYNLFLKNEPKYLVRAQAALEKFRPLVKGGLGSNEYERSYAKQLLGYFELDLRNFQG